MADANKSEKATPHRRQKARERGQIARSRDFSSTLAVCGTMGLLVWQGAAGIEAWRDLFRATVSAAARGEIGPSGSVLFWSGWTVARCAIPVMATAWVLAVSAGVMQGGLIFAPEALAPKMERLSPGQKLSQIFSLSGLSGLLKSLLPFGAILYLSVITLEQHWGSLVQSSNVGLRSFSQFLLAVMLEVAWKSGLVLLAWSGIDYLLTWRKTESDLKMSREEVRQESKETDGNPHTKARIRRIQRQMRRQQMLKETERATVVVTNPTHFAVALLYDMNMDAPIVLAKGQNLLAQRMKEIARWREIPVLENPPLAQALYRSVEVGQTIPAKLYTAVAEVLAFVYRAQAQARQQGTRTPGK